LTASYHSFQLLPVNQVILNFIIVQFLTKLYHTYWNICLLSWKLINIINKSWNTCTSNWSTGIL